MISSSRAGRSSPEHLRCAARSRASFNFISVGRKKRAAHTSAWCGVWAPMPTPRIDSLPLPPHILSRYPWVDDEVKSFLGSVHVAHNSDETVWLLAAADYVESATSPFSWNAWEQFSLDAAKDDLSRSARIKEFWDGCFPIALSVADGYAYFAVRADGTFVYGREPEFEAFEVFATSLSEFLPRLAETSN